jgi:CheY-like chemotaxis protein
MRSSFLIIDPHSNEAEQTRRMLERIQPRAEIRQANSGNEALSLLAQWRTAPSLVFVEFGLPDMTAIELLGQFRQERWLEGTPVALLSQMVDDRVIVHCYRLGASAFLAKPVKAHELRDVIREFGRPTVRLETGGLVPPAGTPGEERRAA